jgi:hypothetical protein
VGSIDHFHHQLQLLEHAGPKTVSPAYRLHTAHPGGSPEEAPGPTTDTSRPKLVLLRPTDDESAADVEDSEGIHYERVGVLDRPDPVCLPEVGADLSQFRREQARNRCTVLLRCLTGVAVSTGLIGIFPSLHLVWIITVLSGVAALALVALIAYAKELQVQRERQRARRTEGGRYTDPASAGHPGGWDDDAYQERRVAEG